MAIDEIGIKERIPYEISLTDRGLDKEWEGLEADPKLVKEIQKRGFSITLPVLKADGMNYTVLEGSEILKASQEAGLKTVWCFIVTREYEVEETEEVETEVEADNIKSGDFVRLAKTGKLCKIEGINGTEVLIRKQTSEGWTEKVTKVRLSDLDL